MRISCSNKCSAVEANEADISGEYLIQPSSEITETNENSQPFGLLFAVDGISHVSKLFHWVNMPESACQTKLMLNK